MKKISRPEASNKRNNRRVVMVKSIKGLVHDAMKDAGIFRAQLVNLSNTGAQVYSNKAIEIGAGVDLELDSLDGSHSVSYTGKVVWARKNPMKAMGRFAYGVNFNRINSEQAKFLETNYSMSPYVPE